MANMTEAEAITHHFPGMSLLSEDQQGQYEDSIKSNFTGRAYDCLNIKRRHGNFLKILYLNQIGIETVTLPQLEAALDRDFLGRKFPLNDNPIAKHSIIFPSGILRSNEDLILNKREGDNYLTEEFNNNLARYLASQVGKTNLENPVILDGLELMADDNSYYGLAIVPGEKFEVIEAPDFSHRNNKRKFVKVNPDYSIEWEDDPSGDDPWRLFYTREVGFSELGLGGGLRVYSNGTQYGHPGTAWDHIITTNNSE